MSIPQAVQKQAEAAQRLQAQFHKGDQAEPESHQEPGEPEGNATHDRKPEAQQQAPESPKAPDDWERRFKGYKASTDNTIYDLRQQLHQQSQQNQALQERVRELSEQRATSPEPASDPLDGLISDEEKDWLGEESLSVMRKVAQAIVDKGVGPVREMLSQLEKERLENTKRQAESAQQSRLDDFRTRVGKLVPEWMQYDNDPQFLAWMSEPDEDTGRIRKDLFIAAIQAFDVRRAADFYREWKTTQAAPQDALQRRVMPNRAGLGSTPDTRGKRFYTGAEIKRFYEDKALGRYRGKEDEARAIEKDIFAAQSEGRIR